MNYGTVGVFGALALGAALGAILPVPAHQGHEPVDARPELSVPRSAEYDYDPPGPGSYELPVLKPAADANIHTLGSLDPRLVTTDVPTVLEEEGVATSSR